MRWRLPGSRLLATTSILLLALAACDGSGSAEIGAERLPAPAMAFDSGVVRIETAADTFTITAEIAERAEQRSQGLMERGSLPDDTGMIFLFQSEQPAGSGFYMFRTRIPLDIAFLDADGAIVAILGMEPCDSPNPSICRRYSPGLPYHAALEMNLGYFERRGIQPGDRLRLERPTGETWP